MNIKAGLVLVGAKENLDNDSRDMMAETLLLLNRNTLRDVLCLGLLEEIKLNNATQFAATETK